MSLTAVAFCPNPPLIVPEVASGAAAELDDLRRACDAAIDTVFAAGPDLIVVVGGASARASHHAGDIGTFAAYGVDLAVALGGGIVPSGGGEPGDGAASAGGAPGSGVAPGGGAALPLSLAVGAWLLRHQPVPPPACGESVPFDLAVTDALAIGARIASRSARVGLVVMGDGSACRGEKSPGYADDRAESFDAAVVAALAAADVDALAAIDVAVAADLLAGGRAAWQVLAGAAGPDEAAGAARAGAAGRRWRGQVHFDAAPYGVQYTVASWALA